MEIDINTMKTDSKAVLAKESKRNEEETNKFSGYFFYPRHFYLLSNAGINRH